MKRKTLNVLIHIKTLEEHLHSSKWSENVPCYHSEKGDTIESLRACIPSDWVGISACLFNSYVFLGKLLTPLWALDLRMLSMVG